MLRQAINSLFFTVATLVNRLGPMMYVTTQRSQATCRRVTCNTSWTANSMRFSYSPFRLAAFCWLSSILVAQFPYSIYRTSIVIASMSHGGRREGMLCSLCEIIMLEEAQTQRGQSDVGGPWGTQKHIWRVRAENMWAFCHRHDMIRPPYRT